MCRQFTCVVRRLLLGACSPDASSSPSISTSSADSSRADVMSAPDESDESCRLATQHAHRTRHSAAPNGQTAPVSSCSNHMPARPMAQQCPF